MVIWYVKSIHRLELLQLSAYGFIAFLRGSSAEDVARSRRPTSGRLNLHVVGGGSFLLGKRRFFRAAKIQAIVSLLRVADHPGAAEPVGAFPFERADL